jgi:hypothetical protein
MSSTKRFVVFTTDEGHKVAVNPDHVRVVEPRTYGATLYLSGPGPKDDGLSRRVTEPFDEVMRKLRDEERPRLAT